MSINELNYEQKKDVLDKPNKRLIIKRLVFKPLVFKPLVFNIVCPEGVIDGCLITKEKRQELYGKVAGGRGSKKPEEDQRNHIILGTGQPCPKTHTRINWRNNELVNKSQPMKEEDGFDYTEDFDGKQIFASNTVLINL